MKATYRDDPHLDELMTFVDEIEIRFLQLGKLGVSYLSRLGDWVYMVRFICNPTETIRHRLMLRRRLLREIAELP